MNLLLTQFEAHLLQENKLFPSSVKNYLSDLNYFLTWLASVFQEPEINLTHLTPNTFQDFRQFLIDQLGNNDEVSFATANRRLSTLRHFGNYLCKGGQLAGNPADNLKNLDAFNVRPASNINSSQRQLLRLYHRYLKQEKLSVSTIKNYLSDLNQYLLWENIKPK